MKNILWAVLMLCAVQSKAIQVTESLEATNDCYGVDIASHQPTALFAVSSHTVNGAVIIASTDSFRYVWVQNVDTSAAVFCRPNDGYSVPTISTSVAASQPNRGARIVAGADTNFGIVGGRIQYCMGNSVTATVPVTVCRGK